ncbi:MAG: DUF2750 domain-containing protein [Lamprocystis purpurea]|jgi:hypothetical protein|uniref:DUF2750 domain-containing protein n=1 Tax=Lamprocystis purpurea TaxID=61598 RepID=UPI000370938B|nr:DUF2750 domain-containing protein [Lamprocystis purpurea]MBV5274409.1 DUF2750 domain-containing protein [Lamprocystis purpurea]
MSDLSPDYQDHHERFVTRVRETGQVWGLKSDEGWAICESNEYEDTDVYPFWSDEAAAAAHCTDDWAGFVPTSLDLDLFIDTWLAGMSEDGVLVGTNWDEELMGLEVEPSDLAEELLIEEYEEEQDDEDDDDDADPDTNRRDRN